MLVVKIFFTMLIVVLSVVVTFSSVRFLVRKVKQIINKKKQNKHKDSEKHTEVIEQKDNESN